MIRVLITEAELLRNSKFSMFSCNLSQNSCRKGSHPSTPFPLPQPNPTSPQSFIFSFSFEQNKCPLCRFTVWLTKDHFFFPSFFPSSFLGDTGEVGAPSASSLSGSAMCLNSWSTCGASLPFASSSLSIWSRRLNLLTRSPRFGAPSLMNRMFIATACTGRNRRWFYRFALNPDCSPFFLRLALCTLYCTIKEKVCYCCC